MIDEDFEAWVHGAVLKPLYFKYLIYGYNNIYMESSLANELEVMNHHEIPWIEARGDLKDSDTCDEVISTDLMKQYYKSRALERGMKEVKNNIFKFSPTRLKDKFDVLLYPNEGNINGR